MREACGLEPIQAGKSTGRAAARPVVPQGIALGCNGDSQETRGPTPDDTWRSTVKVMLAQSYHGMTEHYLRTVSLSGKSERRNKHELWQDMKQSCLWRRCFSVKSAHMLLPVIQARRSYAEVVPTPDAADVCQLQETYDLPALRRYAEGHEHRSQNIQLFAEALTLTRRGGGGKKVIVETLEEFEELAAHLIDSEKAV
ncbi:MAG: hypothetical protein GY772_09355, partial [bacterium]|nr:hypothetical protein [bacterium]